MLFFKRYLLPPIFAFAIYTCVYFLSGAQTSFFNFGLIICILCSLLIRIVDDINDYSADFEKNKVVFSLKTLKILLLVRLICLNGAVKKLV